VINWKRSGPWVTSGPARHSYPDINEDLPVDVMPASNEEFFPPPPTPEQIAAEQEKRALEDARLQREKALLEQVQDRVAQRYRLDHAQRQPAGRVSDTNMPNNVRQLPGTAAPEGGREQSAEAHSAPAK